MISDSSGQYLVRAARAVMQEYLRHNKISNPENYPPDLNELGGVVVEVYKKLPGMQKEIRASGADLNFNKSVAHACAEAARAACGDKRFGTIELQELPVTSFHVHVFDGQPRQVMGKTITDYGRIITAGRDGLIMRKGASTGILMPHLILQNKWSVKEALENLSLKTGLDKDGWTNPSARIFSFRTQIFKE